MFLFKFMHLMFVLPSTSPLMPRPYPRRPHTHLPLIALVFALSVCACATATPDAHRTQYTIPGQTNQRVSTFVLLGVAQVDEAELREGLATQVDPGWRTHAMISWIPLLGSKPSYFNEVEWKRDQERILTFYRTQGFFNARIVSRVVHKTPDKKGRVLRIKIKEGSPTRIESITLTGLEHMPQTLAHIKKNLPLGKGSVFTQRAYADLKSELKGRLAHLGFAYAQIEGRAIVHPRTQSAQLTLYLDSGPRARIGTITITGGGSIKSSYIRDALTIKEGDPYSDQALQESQEAIYDLNIFSFVHVQPLLASTPPIKNNSSPPTYHTEHSDQILKESSLSSTSKDALVGPMLISRLLEHARVEAQRRATLDPNVPILIQLKEAKNLNVRVGAGFSLDSTRQDIHTAGNITSRNVLGTLGKLENFNTVGYAWTPGILNLFSDRDDTLGNHGVIFSSELRYQQPQFLEQRTLGFLLGRLERDVQERYIGLLPSASMGLRRTFGRDFTCEASYNLNLTLYQDVALDYKTQLLKQGLREDQNGALSLLLEFIELRAVYDRRNSPLNPSKGWRLQTSIQRAAPYIAGSQFSYIKPRVAFDTYLPYDLGIPMVLAFRGHLATIYEVTTSGQDTLSGVPLRSRLNAGGRGSMRSFGSRYFGFFTNDPTNPGPIGSITEFDVALEQRIRLVRKFLSLGDVWGTFFVDAGTFHEQPFLWNFARNAQGIVKPQDLAKGLIYGIGGGIWWTTPLGPIRFDLAWTLNDLSQDTRYADPDTGRIRTEVLQKISNNFVLGFDNFFLGVGHSF